MNPRGVITTAFIITATSDASLNGVLFLSILITNSLSLYQPCFYLLLLTFDCQLVQKKIFYVVSFTKKKKFFALKVFA